MASPSPSLQLQAGRVLPFGAQSCKLSLAATATLVCIITLPVKLFIAGESSCRVCEKLCRTFSSLRLLHSRVLSVGRNLVEPHADSPSSRFCPCTNYQDVEQTLPFAACAAVAGARALQPGGRQPERPRQTLHGLPMYVALRQRLEERVRKLTPSPPPSPLARFSSPASPVQMPPMSPWPPSTRSASATKPGRTLRCGSRNFGPRSQTLVPCSPFFSSLSPWRTQLGSLTGSWSRPQVPIVWNLPHHRLGSVAQRPGHPAQGQAAFDDSKAAGVVHAPVLPSGTPVSVSRADGILTSLW